MSRRMRILRNIGIGLTAFVAALVIGALLIIQTGWFRNYVKQKIIAVTEEGTGGKVEIGSFALDWRNRQAIVTDFVIHGNEPAGVAPFVRVGRVQVNLCLFPFNISYLGVDRPEANIIVLDDGRTNVPTPAKKETSDTTALESVVDLAVRNFELTNGLVAFNSSRQPLELRARNLRAQLWYNLLKQGYQGELSIQPIYSVAGRNTPVTFTVTLPVALERDRIDINNARITSAASDLSIHGSLTNLRNPGTSVQISGHVALADLKNLGNLPLALDAPNVASTLEIEARVAAAEDIIQVDRLRVGAGGSNIEASGTLKDPQGKGALRFRTQLAVDELGRLAKVAARPEGTVVANGTATLDARNNYRVTGNIETSGLSFRQGAQHIRNIRLSAGVTLDPRLLNVKGLRLTALGAELAADASLEDFARYQVTGSLRNLDLQNVAHALGQKRLPYDGVVSGPIQAQGDAKVPGTKGVTASVRLSIAPGRRGIPVSGRLSADYSGTADNIDVDNSWIALPHTRLTMSGSVSKRLNLELRSHDLNDLLAAASLTGEPPVTLNSGRASFTGAVTGALTAPHITGHMAVDRFTVQGRQFDSLAADLAAARTRVSVQNGSLNRGAMQAGFAASAGLANWSPTPAQPLSAAVTVRNGDLADIMVLAGRPPEGYSGALSVDVDLGGTIGNPLGSASLSVGKGTIAREPFDSIQAEVRLADQMAAIPAASIVARPNQVSLAAEFEHPRDSLTTGRLHARVDSSHVDLAQLRTLQQERPGSSGWFRVNADMTGQLTRVKSGGEEKSEFLLTGVNAEASARQLRFEGQNYGNFNTKAWTTGQTVSYNVQSDFAGSDIKVNGSTQLTRGYPTAADASIGNLPVERVLVLARRVDVPAQGRLSGRAHLAGTMETLQGNADVELASAVLYDEPIDHIRLRVSYVPQTIDVPKLEIVSGPARIEMVARYDHPQGNLQAGDLQFRVNSSRIELSRIRNVQKARPGLAGTLQIASSGTVALHEHAPKVLFRDLNADIGATGLAAQGTNFGNLALKANTSGGLLKFALDSDLASASIHGEGDAQLSGDYPVNAYVAFKDVRWTRLQPLLRTATGEPPAFDAVTDGQVTLSGPATNAEQLRASLRVSKLQLSTIPEPGSLDKPVVIENKGAIAATLDRGLVRIESARLAGPQTDIDAAGTASLIDQQKLDLNLKASSDLALLRNINRNIFSSGNLVLETAVRGTMEKPLVSGRLELHNASLNHTDLPNGISNANGVVLFKGNTASIESLTAETGGGKLAMSGFVSMNNTLRFGLRATAASVRVRAEQGASIVASANLNLTGATESSRVSGTVTINQITYAPQSDIGSMLTRSAPPIQTPAKPSPLLDNMRLEIRVRTSSSTTVQASVAQNVQIEADLRILGRASQPSVLGRLSVTEGELAFFGSTYTLNSGTISFYNPVRIEPILNFSLQTQAKGVNVVLMITGPVDNMKLSYSSDPPLQFQEIVALLASGKTPTSDPTILANQPSQPAQSLQQMGESAIVSKAVADPLASRVQRVFGVSQFKIDPSFKSGSDLPQARVTLQQQVTSNLTLTYVTALEDPNTQTIRIEWTVNPQWSAMANRDQNGIFSINFLYKKQFR